MPYAGISSFLSGSDDWFPWAFDAVFMTSTKTMKEMTAAPEMARIIPREMFSPRTDGGEGGDGGEGAGVGSVHISD
jgi:hypothetical protein